MRLIIVNKRLFFIKKTVDSLGASTRGLKLVDQKRRQKRWNKTAQIWCREAFTTRSTLNRFWAGKPIRRETFIAICQAVGVDWKEVVAQTCYRPVTVRSDLVLSEKITLSTMGWSDSAEMNHHNEMISPSLTPFKVMPNPTLVREKTFDFAVRIINLCKGIDKNHGVAQMFAKKLMRSGTSIGSNLEESQSAQSLTDVIRKLEIAIKEARETKYWLRLLIAAELIEESPLLSLLGETYELINILAATLVKTQDLRTDATYCKGE